MDKFNEAMKKIAISYRDNLIVKLSLIDKMRVDLFEDWKTESVEQLYLECHSLAGSAATYGYHSVTFEAKKVELFLENHQEGEPDNLWLSTFSNMIDKLVYIPITDNKNTLISSSHIVTQSFTALATKPIFIIDDDVELTNLLVEKLKVHGYIAQGFTTLDSAKKAITKEEPGAIIMDQNFPEGRLAGAQFLQNYLQKNVRKIPIIFSTSHDDFESRYQAVQAHSNAFLTKPYDISELVQCLDMLVAKSEYSNYKVVALDDDVSILQLIEQVLLQAKIDIRTCSEPANILNVLIEQDPDILLLDMHMPNYNGLEIASIIKQHKKFTDLSIIFLTSENSEKVLLQARQNGVDDFIFKPIIPPNLISVVVNKAQQTRSLKVRLRTDAMTGLLLKSTFEQELEMKHKRASRHQQSFLLCIIDLDNFKLVNDKYGHLSGDAVISSFSTMLSSRLRDTDIIGRIGGEEFGVMLSDTTITEGVKLMNEIKDSFSQVNHKFKSELFTVSISVGISCFDESSSLKQMYEAADTALYKAKGSGRNLVKISLKH